MSNLEIIKQRFEEHKGEFVITASHTVERFIGLVDGQEDYYYLLFDGRKIRWQTCVGGLTWLKNKIEDKCYQDLIRWAKLNHHDCANWIPTEEQERIKKELLEIKDPKAKYLVEPYMELT